MNSEELSNQLQEYFLNNGQNEPENICNSSQIIYKMTNENQNENLAVQKTEIMSLASVKQLIKEIFKSKQQQNSQKLAF